jgi:hypothetical protein
MIVARQQANQDAISGYRSYASWLVVLGRERRG